MASRLLSALILAALVAVAGLVLFDRSAPESTQADTLPSFRLESRPRQAQYLWDYGGRLAHYREAAELFLGALRRDHDIEAMIVTLPVLPADHDIDTLAVDLLNGWRIGAGQRGRGLLLLLVDEGRQVRLEVGYALEPLFTDAFSGYIEDLQLKPYYLADDLGTGLIAVMEEIEQRAALNPDAAGGIALADRQLLSGGAGARRDLATYGEAPAAPPPPDAQPGAGTPEEAWRTMLRQWGGQGRGDDPDIYTAMTRLAMGDPKRPDPRAVRDLAHWRDAGYEVLQDADHAIIWFGQKDGWNNAPFLFCRGPAGWQFDIVHQRILVVMGRAPRWYVVAGPHPYMGVAGGLRLSTRKDLPPLPELQYRCRDDREVLAAMQRLEARLDKASEDPTDLLELARLRVATAQRPNRVQPLLNRLLALDPVPPEALQYAAVYNVNSLLQYETALRLVDRYVARRPEDPWGHDMRGFLHYRLSRFEAARADHERALALDPGDGYAHAQLPRVYLQLAHRAESEVQRGHYRDLAQQAFERARGHAEPARLRRLGRWMQARLADG